MKKVRFIGLDVHADRPPLQSRNRAVTCGHREHSRSTRVDSFAHLSTVSIRLHQQDHASRC
jgi:hypothetical protein